MKIVHATTYYLPEVVGGIEVYLSTLIPLLAEYGKEGIVAIPNDRPSISRYDHEGISVVRFPTADPTNIREQIGIDPPPRIRDFEEWLREERADVFHQHCFVGRCSPWQLTTAKTLGLRTIVTFHEPTTICSTNTLLKNGDDECDGLIDWRQCAPCFLRARGMSSWFSDALGRIPPVFARPFVATPKLGPIRLMTTTAQIEAKKRLFDRISESSDVIVAISDWLKRSLEVNGVPAHKLVSIPNGTDIRFQTTLPRRNRKPGSLRVGFIGRCDPLKGLHVLAAAARLLADHDGIEILCHAAVNPGSESYRQHVLETMGTGTKMQLLPGLPRDGVRAFLGDIDVLAVPSQWRECNPLVVLEALAAGTVVVGSALGAMNEVIRHGGNGLLVPHGDAHAWADAIRRLADEPMLLERLQDGISRVRSMQDVADDTNTIYDSLLTSRRGVA